MKELKYLFNWGSFFWLTLFWRCSLEFLSIIIPASWGAVFDLKIPYWLFLETKLSTLFFHFLFHFWFLGIVLLGRCFNSECPGDDFFWFILIFCSGLFVYYLFKVFFERNYLFPFERLIRLQPFLYSHVTFNFIFYLQTSI